MMGVERVHKYIERNVIEVAPLAFMRGRTLNNAFIILDESQNTTIEQMKMFLTRIGFGSTAVITGDITQIDLPRGIRSGLIHCIGVLEGVEGPVVHAFHVEGRRAPSAGAADRRSVCGHDEATVRASEARGAMTTPRPEIQRSDANSALTDARHCCAAGRARRSTASARRAACASGVVDEDEMTDLNVALSP